jgi:2-dehydro-3-deoxyphosphogluconate aldolase/(4S)-4-hydroxy-2-oxoglutarate aldolase
MNSEIQRTLDDVLADGVFLCIRLGTGDAVVHGCRAAAKGGLRVLEVALTTPGAVDVIEELAPDAEFVVGAGTVLTPEDVRRVARAGARFVMSPVFDRGVVDEAHLLGVLAVPGASTPAEILSAHRHGAALVKVFPSGALGGPDYLRALRGPLPDIPLVPTSGPTADTIADYVAAGAVAVGVGREVFPPGYTLQSVETASRRIRSAMDVARRS